MSEESPGVGAGHVDVQPVVVQELVEGVVEGDGLSVGIVRIGDAAAELDFVDEEVAPAGEAVHPPLDVVRQRERIAQREVAALVQGDAADVPRSDARGEQIVAVEAIEQERLPAPTDAGDDLDLPVPCSGTELLQVGRSFDARIHRMQSFAFRCQSLQRV